MSQIGETIMKSPLKAILSDEAVLAAYVFSQEGRLAAGEEKEGGTDRFQVSELGKLANHFAFFSPDLSETTMTFRSGVLLMRSVDKRVVIILAGNGCSPSLIRVVLDVEEHKWRKKGVERIFPIKIEKRRS